MVYVAGVGYQSRPGMNPSELQLPPRNFQLLDGVLVLVRGVEIHPV